MEAITTSPWPRSKFLPSTLTRRSISAALFEASDRLRHGETDLDAVRAGMRRTIEAAGLTIDYATVARPDTLEELRSPADAMVLPSDEESMPRVVLEAMAFELPILATSVWGVPELIENGRNGLLCEPSDLDSMEDGLRRLLSLTPEEAAALGRAGGETLRPERDIAPYAEKIRALFEQPGGGGPSG